jgi:hypothetical protein
MSLIRINVSADNRSFNAAVKAPPFLDLEIVSTFAAIEQQVVDPVKQIVGPFASLKKRLIKKVSSDWAKEMMS